MNAEEIHIEEENIHFFWALLAVVSIALATYMLINAFMAGSWSIAGYTQLISLALFTIGFYGIIRISSPLFHFVLKISHSTLTVEIWNEGDHPVDSKTIAINRIEVLRISPHAPRSPREALFDFSTGYHLLYKDSFTGTLQKLIHLEGESFMLKVQDIGQIMDFLKAHNSQIHVPQNDAIFVELNRPAYHTTPG